MALDEATPLIGAMQEIAKKAKKAGYPRAENGGEFMIQRATERAQGKGPSAQNDLYHGRKETRKSVGGGRVGRYGMTV